MSNFYQGVPCPTFVKNKTEQKTGGDQNITQDAVHTTNNAILFVYLFMF